MNRNKNRTFLIYSLGYLGISIFAQVTVKWYQYFYAPPEANEGGLRLLIPLMFIGLTMIIARIFDGVADPLVAWLSDNCKSRRGRRIPFILYGLVPLTVTFILIWFPPVKGESIINLVYLSAVLSLFYICFTVVVGPYLSLIAEITDNRAERIKLTTMQGITQTIGVMIAEAGSGVLIGIGGFKLMGIVMGVLAMAALLLTPIFVREKPIEENPSPSGLFLSVLRTIRNRNFLLYLAGATAIWFGINTLTISLPYITEVLLDLSPTVSGYFIAGAFILSLLFSPFIPAISNKTGKKRLLIAASFFFALILSATYFYGTALKTPAVAVIIVLAGLPLAVFFIIQNAMVADIAEMDALMHGERREGMFFGAQGLILKISLGISSLITPFVFSFFGSTEGDCLGLQLIGPVAAVFIILGTICLFFYNLSDKELDLLREEKKLKSAVNETE